MLYLHYFDFWLVIIIMRQTFLELFVASTSTGIFIYSPVFPRPQAEVETEALWQHVVTCNYQAVALSLLRIQAIVPSSLRVPRGSVRERKRTNRKRRRESSRVCSYRALNRAARTKLDWPAPFKKAMLPDLRAKQPAARLAIAMQQSAFSVSTSVLNIP